MWNHNIFIYDFEVFAYDWIACYKRLDEEDWYVFHNDSEGLYTFLDNSDWYVGFNNRGYDRYIVKGIYYGLDNEDIKEINDHIIGGGNGWETPQLQYKKNIGLVDIDLMQDTSTGTSLKSFEAHMGMDITESEISFDLDRPLTFEEIKQTVEYCKADVRATEKLFHIREDYINAKIYLAEMKGIPIEEAVQMTNANLTARFLGAKKKEWKDGRDYKYPDNLKTQYIPSEVFGFYNQLHDKNLSDDEIFKDGNKLEIMIGRCPVTISFGGVHAAIPNYLWKEGDKK